MSRAFVRTDCEDGTGIDELRRVVERETDRLDSLRDAFPASWFAIKDELAGMEENYLDFKRYQALCEEYGEAAVPYEELLVREEKGELEFTEVVDGEVIDMKTGRRKSFRSSCATVIGNVLDLRSCKPY